MHFKCTICLDELGVDDAKILTTTCGHLYCMDCATFHFAHDTTVPCAICRSPHRYGDLIMLYPNYEPDSSGTGRTGQLNDNIAGAATEAMDACLNVLRYNEVVQSGTVAEPALESVDKFMHIVDAMDDTVAVQVRGLVTSMNTVLSEIRSRLQELDKKDQAAHEHAHRTKKRYKDRLSVLNADRSVLQETLDHERAIAAQRTEELQVKIQDLRREMHELRSRQEQDEMNAASLENEMNLWKTKCLAYKKKYYANKQFIRNLKHSAGHDSDDFRVV